MNFDTVCEKLTMSTSIKIFLSEYQTDNNRSFKTRPRAVAVRKLANLDTLMSENDEITIVVPSDITLITPAFLEEFFEPTVNRIGVEEVKRRIRFENPGAYKIKNDLHEAYNALELHQASSVAFV
jgi:hypothetical protein